MSPIPPHEGTSFWTVHTTACTNELWTVHFRGSHVANVWWVVRLDHPDVARVRLEEGLNQRWGDTPTPRCWTIDDPVGHRVFRHNGRDCGSWEWIHPPRRPAAATTWAALVLAGLNASDVRRGVISPCPLPPN